jgi:hypothetical protein
MNQPKTMDTQPTPRTDAEHDRICESWGSAACDYDKMKDFSCQIERELAAVTAQRDMLARALEKVSRSWNYVEVAREAIQSLTPNDE